MVDGHPASIPDTVRVGGRSKSELLQALREHGVELNHAAETLFEDPRFTTLERADDVEIAVYSVSELGFAHGTTYDRLVQRARELGWAECPLETGPHLRLQFLHQPEGAIGLPTTHGRAPPGSITIASPPLDDRDETPKGFYLRRVHGVLWLRGYRSWSGHVWNAEDVLVFSRRPGHDPESDPRPGDADESPEAP